MKCFPHLPHFELPTCICTPNLSQLGHPVVPSHLGKSSGLAALQSDTLHLAQMVCNHILGDFRVTVRILQLAISTSSGPIPKQPLLREKGVHDRSDSCNPPTCTCMCPSQGSCNKSGDLTMAVPRAESPTRATWSS